MYEELRNLDIELIIQLEVSKQDRYKHIVRQLVERKEGEDLGIEQMATANLGT